MKIFSSFDTELSQTILASKQAQYGERSVLFIRRDPIYLAIKVYAPLLVRFLWSILLVVLTINLSPEGWWNAVLRTVLWLIVIAGIRVWIIATRKSIDYSMDYTIVTPDEILQYDQEWILDRVSRSISVSKLKTISVRKGWLRWSIFNYWAIVFFSEWDSSGSLWDIRLNYISDPTALKDRITRIVDITLQE
jgi:hypothetical protein